MELGIASVATVTHPFRTKLIADVANIDDMIDMLRGVQGELKSLRVCEGLLRQHLGFLTTGDLRTRRLVTDKFVAKVVLPSDSWSQSPLKELWRDDPEQSEVYLQIATLAPKMIEVKKMENATGNERFEVYKAKLLGARSASTAPPTITIEEEK